MKKVVLNKDYGGFGLSRDALVLLLLNGFPLEARDPDPKYSHLERYVLEGPAGTFASTSPYDSGILRGGKLYHYPCRGSADAMALRSHPTLVKVVEALGEVANGLCAKLSIEAVPSNAAYLIEERDGLERLVLADSRFVAGFRYSDEPLAYIPTAGVRVLPDNGSSEE